MPPPRRLLPALHPAGGFLTIKGRGSKGRVAAVATGAASRGDVVITVSRRQRAGWLGEDGRGAGTRVRPAPSGPNPSKPQPVPPLHTT